LTDGDYTYEVRVVDAAGNVGSTDSQLVTVDTTAPDASTIVIAIDSISDDTGLSSSDFITSDNSLTVNGSLTGTLATGEVAQISVDGGNTWSDLTVSAGLWSYVDSRSLTDGDYTYEVRVVDAAGNVGSTDSQLVTVDTTAPIQTVTIQNYEDNVGSVTGKFPFGTTDDRAPILNGIISSELNNDEHVAIFTSANEFVGYATVTGTDWSYELNGLSDGMTYTYYASVMDQGGNLGTFSNNFTISIDLTVVVNSQDTLDTTPIISGSTGFDILEGEYLEVTVNGKTYSSQTGTVIIDFDNNTWYTQIPEEDMLPIGTYDVVAVLRNSEGEITKDDTSAELIINPPPIVDVGAGSGDLNQKATAVTLNTDGTWLIHSNQAMWISDAINSGTLGDFIINPVVSNSGTGYDLYNYVQNATFIDYNRDGLMDLFTVDSNYDDGQQMFFNTGSSWVAYQVGANSNSPQSGDFAGDADTDGSANTWSWYGGIIAIDKNGDGLVDIIYGDQTPNDSAIQGGYGSQIVLNNNGTIVGMDKDGTFATDYAANSTHQPIGLDQSQPDMELSGVDINNDGIVDFVMHSQNIVADGSRINSTGAISTNQARLVVVNGTDSGTWNVTQVVENVFQRGTDSDPAIGNAVAMTWADFNNDGYMDLFLGRGSESLTSATAAGNGTGEYASRIYFNDGGGKIVFDDPNNDGIGNPTATGMYNFTDNIAGGASIALDWNGDGKTDIIELPGMYSTTGGVTAASTTGPVNLYTNTSSESIVSFTTTNLLTQIGLNTIGYYTSTSNNDMVTGAVAIDIDWDGDRDLLIFTSKGNTRYIENLNQPEVGTVIHVRILDKEGINSFYGNTVQLIDELTGEVVSTQILNPQSGNQTNDSTALIDFYGLDETKTYTVKLLSTTNYEWNGLTTGATNEAYIFTAESALDINNASSGMGIIGTGYNDIFYATQGTDLYNGAGGTEIVSDVKSWSNTAGQDIVDYIYAGSEALTINLSDINYQNTGFGFTKFFNIEGIAGAKGNDVLTDNEGNNQFEGRGGNDIFNLINGGNDTLLYKLLNNADALGGNDSDVVNGFHIGTWEATSNADRIDLSELLVDYNDSITPATYINGMPTLASDAEIRNYLTVESDGINTTISIDRDGGGNTYSSTVLITLNNVDSTLEKLLANHQIIIG